MSPGTGMRVVHDRVPGRLRVETQALRRRPELEESVQHACLQVSGVRGARVRAVTGTVLVTFEGAELEQLLKDLQGAVDGVLAAAPPRSIWARAPVPPHAGQARAGAAVAEELGSPWHVLDVEVVVDRLGGNLAGLSAADASERLLRDGTNAIAPPARRSAISLFAGQLASVPVLLLAGSAVLSLATGGLADAAAIGTVVLLNATIGYVTESNAEKTLRLLDGGDRQPARVLRDGLIVEVPAEHVVPGDVLMLAPGDLVAADARLVDSERLMVDESSLTGESVPADKTVATLADERAPLADRANLVFMGTIVCGGSGRAVVVGTGSRTELGRIHGIAGAVELRATPLQEQLRRLGLSLALGSGAVCGSVLLVGLLRGQPLLTMLRTSVSLAVAAVPEGLPTVAITTLALGIRRMREKDVVVRRLAAVEALGAVQVLCLDKTGTITQNRMTAVLAFVGDEQVSLQPVASGAATQGPSPEAQRSLARLFELVTLCSEVEIARDGGGAVELTGSPTERALVEAALASGVDLNELRRRFPRRSIGYRAKSRNYMVSVHDDGGERLVSVKGSPSEVLALCGERLVGGEKRQLDTGARALIETENERMAGRALRVLGVAYRQDGDWAESEGAPPARDLVWVGLVAMVDPVRPHIAELLERFHAAGIDTVMITGDQSATAHAVARQIRLRKSGTLEILDSIEIDRLSPEVLRSLSAHVDVFARVSPTHKLRIVQALQASGRVVAMTGDGINDGPALKAADVGVALGKAGSQAARQVADVVLTTDDLSAMVGAVEQGRTIYDDIKKALRFILATNLSELLLMFTSVAAGMGEPLTPMQLLWINVLTDVFPELALAVQPSEEDVMARPPRDPGQPMFQRGDLAWLGVEATLIASGAMAVYGTAVARGGPGPRASTLAFMSLTSAQLLHAVSARSEHHTIFDREHLAHNPYIQLSIGGGLALQLLATLLPPLRALLGTTRLRRGDWLLVTAGAVGPFLANEALKLARRTQSLTRHQGSRADSIRE